jgi:Protein of unknown function (DUF2528)
VKKTYEVSDGEATLTLEIDTAVLSAELATMINNFWHGSKQVLERSGGDIYQAVARRAARPLFIFLSQGFTSEGAMDSLCDSEGWPPISQLGIKMVDSYLPTFNATDVKIDVR